MLAGMAALLTACSQASPESPAPSPVVSSAPMKTPLASDPAVIAQLEADVGYLASDELGGREAGEPGYDLAAEYVAERYQALGLKAVGDDGSYLQNITFHAIQSNLLGGAIVSINGGDEQDWEPGVDYIGASIEASAELSDVPVVFAGYGLVSEAHDRNDYAGLDVKGKIALLVMGAPDFLPSQERAHYSSVQSQVASEHGAIGIIRLLPPSFEQQRVTFAALASRVGRAESLRWVRPDGETHSNAPNLVGGLVMGEAGATKLFAAMGRDWQEIASAAETGKGVIDGFDTGITISMRFDNTIRDFDSANVVGLVPGADPALADEIVVVIAHLDHVGVNGVGEDKIHNGAMDNAVGVAAILEAARQMADDRPARPVLFAAVTAEEKGLLGSDYLARHNPVAGTDYVAAINLDMPVVTFPFEDLVAFGAERSSLGSVAKKATSALGVTLSPDPMPEQGFFTRSDHYSFVKQGVPSLFLVTGPGGPGAEEFQTFLATHYHKPSDEVDLVLFDQLERFAALNATIIRDVANMTDPPQWMPGDFFGTAFDGPMAGD